MKKKTIEKISGGNIINLDLIQKMVEEQISKQIDEDFIRAFIAQIVRLAIAEKRDGYSSTTRLEEELQKAVRETIEKVLIEEIEKRKDEIRKAVKRLLEERGFDKIIDRITKVSAQKIAEAIRVEAWIEK